MKKDSFSIEPMELTDAQMAELFGADGWGDAAMWIAGRVGGVVGGAIGALFSSAFTTTLYAPGSEQIEFDPYYRSPACYAY